MVENSIEKYLQIHTFETAKGGRDITIGHITDLHIGVVNDEDMRNYEIADTYFHRKWLRDGQSLPAFDSALAYCQDFDLTVLSGDVLDYYSTEAEKTVKERFARYNVMACVGGHDLTLEMETGNHNLLPLEERYRILEKFWCNDVHYTSRVLGDKVSVVVLDNNNELWMERRDRFDESQYKKLSADIEEARRRGLIMLMFMHEPLPTGRENDVVTDTFTGKEYRLACDMGGEFTKKTYELIIRSADVIKGLFVGHLHMDFVTDIEAGYEKDGKFVKAPIRQCGLTSNVYGPQGRVNKIIVK